MPIHGILAAPSPPFIDDTKVSRGQSPTRTDITFYVLVALVDTMRLHGIQSSDPLALTSFSSIIRPLSIMVYAAKGDIPLNGHCSMAAISGKDSPTQAASNSRSPFPHLSTEKLSRICCACSRGGALFLPYRIQPHL